MFKEKKVFGLTEMFKFDFLKELEVGKQEE